MIWKIAKLLWESEAALHCLNLRVSEPDFKVVHTEIIAQVQLCRKMLSAERFFLSQVFFFGGGEGGGLEAARRARCCNFDGNEY